ncbi:MAG: WecB/TagA/CpsF family glycosyltransferase [Vicinamibacteria bacterium]|nr:WecB/TagA/CpsF family glycosyltransferase [Vicinamibacteria bacterium]
MRILDFVAGALGLPLFSLALGLLSALGLRFDVKETLTVTAGARLFWRRRLVFRDGPLAGFANRLGLAHTLDCLALMRGHLALVGPRPLPPLAAHAVASYRIALRPGLVSPFAVRQWAHIAYDSEEAVDFAYAGNRSWRGDLGILVRSLLARAHGSVRASSLDRVEIDGIPVDNLTLGDAVGRIVGFLDKPQHRVVSFVNADCINKAAHDEKYGSALRVSDLVLGDGVGVRLFSRLIGEPLRENVNGTDLFPRLCEALQGTSHSIYLLGGLPGVAGAVSTWIQSTYPRCRVAGFYDGYFSAEEEREVIRDIERSKPTLILVAFGAPRQEIWLRENLASTGAKVGIGVGGLFDFFSGRIPRAPMWMREAGLEWVYRLSREPKRLFWRYGPGNVEFLGRALWAAFRRQLERRRLVARNAH